MKVTKLLETYHNIVKIENYKQYAFLDMFLLTILLNDKYIQIYNIILHSQLFFELSMLFAKANARYNTASLKHYNKMLGSFLVKIYKLLDKYKYLNCQLFIDHYFIRNILIL